MGVLVLALLSFSERLYSLIQPLSTFISLSSFISTSISR